MSPEALDPPPTQQVSKHTIPNHMQDMAPERIQQHNAPSGSGQAGGLPEMAVANAQISAGRCALRAKTMGLHHAQQTDLGQILAWPLTSSHMTTQNAKTWMGTLGEAPPKPRGAHAASGSSPIVGLTMGPRSPGDAPRIDATHATQHPTSCTHLAATSVYKVGLGRATGSSSPG